MRPLLLLSNDDGFRSEGIAVLREALRSFADVVICAPEHEQSASSHSLSLHRPLRLQAHGDDRWSVDGTPADAVYVALHSGTRVLPRRPDLVVSGMNHGPNLGDDVFYSGTVAAAREGALKGLRALACSADLRADLPAATRIAARVVSRLLELDPLGPLLLNLNVPAGTAWPLVSARLGTRIYEQGVEYRSDPRGREYLWLGGRSVSHPELELADTLAYDRGEASLSALRLDLWDEQRMPIVRALCE